MKSGLVSISFRKKEIKELIKAAKESGLEYIEWGGDVHIPMGNVRLARKKQLETTGVKVNVMSLFPWFILGFLALAVINSTGIIPAEISKIAKASSKFLMVSALAAIGLGTSLKDMKKAGVNPMLHGFIISILVVIVALAVEWCMGMI